MKLFNKQAERCKKLIDALVIEFWKGKTMFYVLKTDLLGNDSGVDYGVSWDEIV